jgi:hypothetical protein
MKGKEKKLVAGRRKRIEICVCVCVCACLCLPSFRGLTRLQQRRRKKRGRRPKEESGCEGCESGISMRNNQYVPIVAGKRTEGRVSGTVCCRVCCVVEASGGPYQLVWCRLRRRVDNSLQSSIVLSIAAAVVRIHCDAPVSA